MNTVDANPEPHTDNQPEGNLGIPVIALVGLPLVALLLLVFLCFGLVLQSERGSLSKAYSERTAESLARDLADQLGDLISPAATYVDNLAAAIEATPCRTADCVFSIVERQRNLARQIPSQVDYIGFGEKGGRFFGIFKTDENDHWFLGSAKTSAIDPTRLLSRQATYAAFNATISMSAGGIRVALCVLPRYGARLIIMWQPDDACMVKTTNGA